MDRLRSVPLFAGCSDKELSFIASRADEVDLPSGKVLTEKGKSGGDFFIILEGKADTLPEQAFFLAGTLDDVKANAAKLGA